MAFALGMLVFWILVGAPIGLLIHRYTLGTAARTRALPVATVTGLAVLVSLLGAGVQSGITMRHLVVATVVLAVACIVVVWRGNLEWRSRELLMGALPLVLLAAICLGAAGWKGERVGPLGYGTGHEPVVEVAQIRNLTSGHVDVSDDLARRAQHEFEKSYPGFQVLAAFTSRAGDWSPYHFHALIGAILAALMSLPLFVLARWRDIGRAGVALLGIAGCLSPLAVLHLANGSPAAAATALFAVSGVVAIMLARRDPGWFAIATIHACAVLVVAGPVALVPPIGIAGAWWLIAHRVREHKAQVERGLEGDSALTVAVGVTCFATFAAADGLVNLSGLPWSGIYDKALRSITAWPFAWLNQRLEPAAPHTSADWLIWSIFIVLCASACAFAWRRMVRHEVAFVLAAVLGVGVSILTWLAAGAGDTALVELAWLCASPLLLVGLFRVLLDVREAMADRFSNKWITLLPGLAAIALCIVAIAQAGSTGTRATPAPPLALLDMKGGMLVAVDEPWIDYMSPTVHLWSGRTIDADRIAAEGAGVFRYGRFSHVVLSNDPLASDPPGNYEPEGEDLGGSFPVSVYRDISDLDEKKADVIPPIEHTPVEERLDASPGGLLIPGIGEDGNGKRIDVSKPDCSGGDHHFAAAGARGAVGLTNKAIKDRVDEVVTETLEGETHLPEPENTLDTSLAAVGCWTTKLHPEAKTLVVHVKEVGLVFAPRPTNLDDGAWKRETVHGFPGYSTTSINATARYGEPPLIDSFDLTVEGNFPYGTNLAVLDLAGTTTTLYPIVPARRWSQTMSSVTVSNDEVRLISAKSGARTEAGRLFMRRIDVMPNSCDMVVSVGDGKKASFNNANQSMELELEQVERDGDDRIAHLVLRNGLAHNGIPINVMADWVEQYSQSAQELPKSLACPSQVKVSLTGGFGN